MTPASEPHDIYQQVADTMTMMLRDDLQSDATVRCGRDAEGAPRERAVAELAQEWLSFGVTRAVCKRPTMTYGYGARSYGYTEQILADTLSPAQAAHRLGAGPWPFRDDGFAAAVFLAARMTEAVERVVLKAAEAMEWLQSAASLAASEGMPIRWTTPDGFPVIQAYPDMRRRRVRTAIGGKSVSLHIREPSTGVDARRQRQGVAPNFVHSLDAAHLRLTVRRAVGEGVSDFALIHDSFGVHAAKTPRFFQIIRETLVEMYDSVDVMKGFRDEILGQLNAENGAKFAPPPEPGALDLMAVLESEYCFA